MDDPTLSVHEAIFTARSMRHFKPDPIPREKLEYVVEAATMAPSAGNMQSWSFIVVTDEQQRARIAAVSYTHLRAHETDS